MSPIVCVAAALLANLNQLDYKPSIIRYFSARECDYKEINVEYYSRRGNKVLFINPHTKKIETIEDFMVEIEKKNK